MQLFYDGVEPGIVKALQALSGAAAMGVPWPFKEQDDQALLVRIREKYPDLDVGDLVEKFLAWCLDDRFWEQSKTVRWRSRLWTWATNDERFRAQRRAGAGGRSGGSSRTHHVATAGEHGDATEALEQW